MSFVRRARRRPRRAVVALTFANEVRGSSAEKRLCVVQTRGEQARGLFQDAERMSLGADGVPEKDGATVRACGGAAPTGGRRAVARGDSAPKHAADLEDAPPCDAFDATAAELEVDWEGRGRGRPAGGRAAAAAAAAGAGRGVQSARARRVCQPGRRARRSCFAVRQRGMPSGFAATVVLEVFGNPETTETTETTENALCAPCRARTRRGR